MVMAVKIFFILLSIVLIGLDIHFLPIWFPKSLSMSSSLYVSHTYGDLSWALIFMTLISVILAVGRITINGNTVKGFAIKKLFNANITMSKPSIADIKNAKQFTFTIKTTPRKEEDIK